MGHFKGVVASILLSSLAFAADSNVPSITTPHSDDLNPVVKVEEKKSEPTEEAKSKVWRFTTIYSRGNDDANENLARGGMYETAKMKFGLIVKEENGKIQVWMDLAPTLSTEENKGAQLALQYGARAVSLSNVHTYSAAEKAARKEEFDKAEKARVALLKASLADRRGTAVELLGLREKDLAELKSLLEKLEKVGPERVKENEETIDRLTKLIAKAIEAKKNPGTDERAEKLPVSHLRSLLTEAENQKNELKAKVEQREAKEFEVADMERRVEQVRASIAEMDAVRIQPRTAPDSNSVEQRYSAYNQFVRFKYGDEKFEKDLRSYKPVDPTGQSMAGMVYVGEAPLPTNGQNQLRGLVNIENNGQSVKHTVKWEVNIKDGVVKSGQADPINERLKMWQLVDVKVTTPDKVVHDNPGSTPLEKGFVQKNPPKAAPVVADKPATKSETKSVAFEELSFPEIKK